ncbi:MAG TPA: efflux RND transporter periplasmic adaptor subunit [Patescibacteria group bacterium]|nr:efflux RND transporter periplasmic adaptor subunit [Patescibacteria group bacterium]
MRRWIVALLILLLAYAGWRIFARPAPATQAQGPGGGHGRMALAEVPVLATAARAGDIGLYVSALGTVTPVYTVTVTSRVQGQIMEVHYREGQDVTKGDPLIDIDPRPYQAALTQAEGQLAHDQALLTGAQIDLDRYQAAFSRNAIAKQQVDDQTQLVKQYEGTVKNDQGVVENARVNLIYCHITSPIDGRVGLRLVDPGNIVQANSSTPLVVVTQLHPITVIFNVAEDYLGQIQDQLRRDRTMEVDVFDRAVQKKLGTGKLLTIDNQIDPSTGTVKLRALFDNRELTLFPNQFVNAKLLVNMQHNATLVPTPAVQRNSQGTYVYVIGSDMKATIHSVTEGTTDGSTTAVQGINPGDLVATDGFDKLQDGVKVRIRGSKSAAAAGAVASDSHSGKSESKEAATK